MMLWACLELGARGEPSGGVSVRIAALLFGLTAALLALLAPSALDSGLLTEFMQLWSGTPTERLVGTAIWYGLPAVAVLGGLLAVGTPGLAVIPLGAAALGWASIALALGNLGDVQLIGPAAIAGLAAFLSLVATELQMRRRRLERRRRRAIEDHEQDHDMAEAEAALRLDPMVVEADAEPPRRVAPLSVEVPAMTERIEPVRGQDVMRRTGNWAEAVRPGAEQLIEPEPPADPESPFDLQTEHEPVRAFRWDRTDAPPGLDTGGRSGPRLVRRPIVDVIAEPVRRAPEPPPAPPVAAPPVAPQPEVPERWEEPQERRQRGGALVAALAAVLTMVVLAALVAGGYLAYRGGWVDRLVALVQPADAGNQTVIPDAPGTEPEGIAVLPSVPTAETPVPSATTVSAAAFTDPFAYCGAVGTIDHVDGRYGGAMVTPAILRALSLPQSATRDRVHWRCVDGAVLACASYVGPVCDMAPSPAEMQEYCARYTTAPQLLAPGGTWSCLGGKPRLPPDAEWTMDARGFRSDSWVSVSPPASAG